MSELINKIGEKVSEVMALNNHTPVNMSMVPNEYVKPIEPISSTVASATATANRLTGRNGEFIIDLKEIHHDLIPRFFTLWVSTRFDLWFKWKDYDAWSLHQKGMNSGLARVPNPNGYDMVRVVPKKFNGSNGASITYFGNTLVETGERMDVGTNQYWGLDFTIPAGGTVTFNFDPDATESGITGSSAPYTVGTVVNVPRSAHNISILPRSANVAELQYRIDGGTDGAARNIRVERGLTLNRDKLQFHQIVIVGTNPDALALEVW